MVGNRRRSARTGALGRGPSTTEARVTVDTAGLGGYPAVAAAGTGFETGGAGAELEAVLAPCAAAGGFVWYTAGEADRGGAYIAGAAELTGVGLAAMKKPVGGVAVVGLAG